jgi:hypothetical protein
MKILERQKPFYSLDAVNDDRVREFLLPVWCRPQN